jgi:hypothetical protein
MQGNGIEHKGPFGSCCEDLDRSMNLEMTESFFRIENNGVLYLTIGYIATDNGPGFFDAAVMFCPFCGKQLQDREEVAARAGV